MSGTCETSCGFVAVIGAPNAGKSTLMNALVGTKISIVSRKVQTTRSRITGIAVHKDAQIIFVDTPGIFAPKKRLDRAMVAAAWEGAADADCIALVVDASRKDPVQDVRDILASLAGHKTPCLLVLNKVDLVAKADLLAMAKALNEIRPFAATFMISALQRKGLDALLDDMSARMPEGLWHYPEDVITDMPARLLAAEMTREQIFNRLHQELPYSIAVETEHLERRRDGSIDMRQVIYVSRATHKGIVLGKNGATIKAIGQAARQEIGLQLDETVHLKLFVKVRENWMDDPERYRMMGLNPDV